MGPQERLVLLEAIAAKTEEVRAVQKFYFVDRRPSQLMAAKRLEHEVDSLLRKLPHPDRSGQGILL